MAECITTGRRRQLVRESSILKQSRYVCVVLWYLSPEQSEAGRAISPAHHLPTLQAACNTPLLHRIWGMQDTTLAGS